MPGERAVATRKKFYWIWLLVMFGVVALSATVILTKAKPYTGAATVVTGDNISGILARDLVTGAKISIPSHGTEFIFYYNYWSPNDLQALNFASYLMRNGLAPRVSFVAITAGRSPELEKMRRSGELAFPLVDDPQYSIAQRLTVPQKVNRFFVISPTGKILFGPPNGSVSSENIQELVELFTSGRIQYPPPSPSARALLGKYFPNIRVQQISTGRTGRIFAFAPPAAGRRYIVFSAACAACSVSGGLSKMQPTLKQSQAVAIITSRVPGVELRQLTEELGLTGQIYLAQQEITGLENLYFGLGPREGAIVIARVNSKGLVKSVKEQP